MFGLGAKNPVVGQSSLPIGSSPEAIFRFIAQDFFENYPRWSPEVLLLQKLTDGAMGPGTVARQVRVDQGHRSDSEFRVEIYEPSRRLSFSGIKDPYRCTYEIQPFDGENSRLTFTFELLELLIFMRPFEKLVRLVIQDGAERTTRNLKRLIEATLSQRAPTTTSPSDL
ncbi:SRPBCC family protein [Methylococcus sp. EFPC2]|uniref:SRPBCC family protein n=1 Tax=Methylococcus sp. EFPC2 TaxID=2812648 RepID=UPI001966D9AA|nr:SRPBCC family protein [Methylococcus sp. EFPC2]QSA95605.1 SRPBCC family protein [Methylococcus sp. EFPC2]